VVKWRRAGWRVTMVAGLIAGFTVFSPLIAAADEDGRIPSGAVITLGGVPDHRRDCSRGRGHRCDDGGVLQEARVGIGTSRGTDQALSDNEQHVAQVGDSRPLVLPNTGGGPVDDENTIPFVPMGAGLAALGAAGFLGFRRSGKRVRGS
jgi:hypothetical protein